MNDELTARYLDLSDIQSIPNVARYAFEWKMLADDADANGRPSLAAMCHARAAHYGKLVGGEYLRLIDLPFSELIMVLPA